MTKRNHKANPNMQDSRSLSNLVDGLSLEGIQEEIYIVKKLIEFNTERFKDYLSTKSSEIDYRIDKGKSIIVDVESKQQLVFSKRMEEASQAIVRNANHWLHKVAKFTPKEILILLYFEMV